MSRDKLIESLLQIKVLAEESLCNLGHDGARRKSSSTKKAERKPGPIDISFSMNVLAFMNTYGRKLKGPHKFTLLVARLAKGNVSQQVSSADLERHWNKMKAVLGGKFNCAYANRAKSKGWVDSPKHGAYTLSSTWKEVLSNG